ncbi:hypothetical protein E2C01_073653 [Portunus trituberculatus]|uniref:Uncharacterized protein n=1 Tax=Portunus trituberculatus TaxID=210409 RepID=A0A5B7I3K8_PORTR|nr:hypothetical protein [Portunus trituberculatus]
MKGKKQNSEDNLLHCTDVLFTRTNVNSAAGKIAVLSGDSLLMHRSTWRALLCCLVLTCDGDSARVLKESRDKSRSFLFHS